MSVASTACCLLAVTAMATSFPPALVAAAPVAPTVYTVREWHTDDGLPSEIVTEICQDRHGYLWVATSAGLARFDGSHFKLETPDPAGHPTRAPFLAVAEMPDGALFLVPREGDPLILRQGKFVAQPLPDPFAGQPVTAAQLEADGTRWFALRDGVVLRVGSTGTQVFRAGDGISPRPVTRFALDGQGRTWLVSYAALRRYESGQLVPVDAGTGTSELRIASSRQGGPWVISADRVLKLDGNDHATEVATIPLLIGAHYVSMACEDRNGGLWLATRSQGVHHVTIAGHEHVPTTHDQIFAIREDAEGNIWVGTNTGGLNAIGPKILRLYDKSVGLLANPTYSVCEDTAGDVWFANGDGGLVRMHEGTLDILAKRIGWPTFGTVSVSPARDGGVWLAGSPGLYRVTADVTAEQPPLAVIAANGVRRVTYPARNGDLWLSLDPDRIGRWRAGLLTTYGAAEGFIGREVRAVAEDEHGTIWVGTTDGHLLRGNGARFDLVPIPLPASPGAINALHFEGEGMIWIGTTQSGIVILTGSGAQVLDTEHGLPDNNITQLVADGQGCLWCGSSRGIFRLNRAEVRRFLARQTPSLSPMRLGKDDGLKNITCTGIYFPGATRSRDGKIWFATRQGVLAIDPAAAALNPKPPQVAIDAVRSDGHPQPLARRVVLPPYARKLEIVFSILCLSAPTRVQAHYRLDGFDSEWLVADASHIASYPRLPPGEYRFWVNASFGGASESDSSDSLTIVVPPLWWQTVWGRGGALLALVGVVALTVRALSHRRLRRKLDRLERQAAIERERARIAQNIHDDVGASLTRISLLTQDTQLENTPQAESLNRIYETTREITRSLDEIVWAVDPQHDTLESFAGYLADFAQDFLSVAGVRCRLDIPARLPPVLLTSQIRHQLFLCCREALNNVAKHARANEVVLQLQLEANQLQIEIADDGCGWDSPPAGAARDRVRSGHGLANMRRRMTDLGGTCTIENAPTGGTIITMRLSLEPGDPGAKMP